jgi:hypothetical protein
MNIGLYDLAVASTDKRIAALGSLIETGAEQARAKGFDESVFLATRLMPDMLPLVRQVQIAADFAKNAPSRIAGVEPPKMPDEEKSFADLVERVAKTRAYLATLTPEMFEGRETAEITFPTGPGSTMTLAAVPYLLNFALPNLHFHHVTAYAIMRAAGLSIGKRDFIGGL